MDSEGIRLFFQLILSGLIVGCIYASVALGFVLIYKATDIINFAQGELMLVGAYICYALITEFKIPFVPAFLLTLVFSAVLGVLIEVLVLRPMVGEPIFSVIMITIGLATLFRSIIGLIWGHDVYPFNPFPETPLEFFNLTLMPVELITCIAVAGLVVLFLLFFHYSRLGIAMRATAFNQKYALLMGVSVRKIFSLAWVFASVVASIGGIFLAGMFHISPEMSYIGLKVFPAVILGGIDSIAGAMLGSLIIGVVENLAGGYLSQVFGSGVKELSAFAILIVILMIKPYGLFGKEEVIRV